MTLTALIVILLVVFVLGLMAYWLINRFFEEKQPRTIAMIIVGTILLLFLLSQFFPEIGSYRIWK